MTKLMGLNFKIVYRKGKENLAADALSRIGHLMTTQAISTAQPLWIQEVLNAYATDPVAQTLLTQLAIHSPNEHGFSLRDGLIRHGSQIWIAENSALRTKLIAAMHSSAIGGHSGTVATYQRIKRSFYWKGLKQDVEDFVKECSVCQQAKHELIHPAGLLQPLPVPAGVWQDLTMDFIEGLPKSEGFDTILVLVDRFSKYAHLIALTHPFSASKEAKVFLDCVVRLHGFPKSIVSDRDRIFTSTFWKELFRLSHTTLLHSSAYHPQTNGQSERVNQCLEMYLRCAVNNFPKKWHSWQLSRNSGTTLLTIPLWVVPRLKCYMDMNQLWWLHLGLLLILINQLPSCWRNVKPTLGC